MNWDIEFAYSPVLKDSGIIKLLAIKGSYYNMPKNNILEFFTIALLIVFASQQCCQKFTQQVCV